MIDPGAIAKCVSSRSRSSTGATAHAASVPNLKFVDSERTQLLMDAPLCLQGGRHDGKSGIEAVGSDGKTERAELTGLASRRTTAQALRARIVLACATGGPEQGHGGAAGRKTVGK